MTTRGALSAAQEALTARRLVVLDVLRHQPEPPRHPAELRFQIGFVDRALRLLC